MTHPGSPRWRTRLLGLLLLLSPLAAVADGFDFQAPPRADDAGVPAAMRDLAERILPVYEEPDPERYASNLSALQLVAQTWEAANDSRLSLEERRVEDASWPVDRAVYYDLYAHAKAAEAAGGTTFADAYDRAFREVVPRMADREANALMALLESPPALAHDALQAAFDRVRGKQSVDFPQAMELVWTWLFYEVHRAAAPRVATLGSEEAGRRYAAEGEIVLPSRGGREIVVRVVRPKKGDQKLPALLEFTIDPGQDSTRASAAHGYAGVVAWLRARPKSGAVILPFAYDGEAARAVIAWITKQPWSDGRVGMVGTRYSAFAAWAAARHAPAALKAIATADAMAPGIDFPSEGRIYRNSAYRWALGETQGEGGAADADGDVPWRAIDEAWYRSGKRYRAYERIGQRRSPAFSRWLDHPSYDRYWQKFIPYGSQFAKIDIPVLSTTGTYSDGAVGALWYFGQHTHFRPDADHTLVIGPWDDAASDVTPEAAPRGEPVDAAARIDLRELRFRWLDHVFKGAPNPELLADRVNVETTGANRWRHGATLEAIAGSSLRLYLAPADTGDQQRLATGAAPEPSRFLPQIVQFSDRADAGWRPPMLRVEDVLQPKDGVTFTSDALEHPVDVGGLVSGLLDFHTNKQDMDLNVTLYERRADGTFVPLSDPYEFRASYANDRVHRRLLHAGARQQLAFTSEQVASRRLAAGSRLLLVLGINKRPDREVNYGAGNDVKEESIADARVPMKVRWYGGSYIDVPVRR